MYLIIGATGELGTAVIRRLNAGGEKVRAFVREDSHYQHLQGDNIQLAFGDLRNPISLNLACHGVEAVIATANTVIPRRRGYRFNLDEGKGYQNLITTCRQNGVKRFVFISVPKTPQDSSVDTFRYKRLIEMRLEQSGLSYTIFRGSLFMNDWFALLGSRTPLRGAESATLERPFWFSQLFMKLVGNLIDGHGLALVPGNGKVRHAFITKENAAEFLVRAVHNPQADNRLFNLGGPEILSFDEVVELFGKALGRTVRPLHLPAEVFRLQSALLKPISPAAANLMGLNWLAGTYSTPYPMSDLASMFGVELTSAEEFLREKVRIPAVKMSPVFPTYSLMGTKENG